MPIKIDYSPVETLMELAQATGLARAKTAGQVSARSTAAEDLAYTRMILNTQAQYAQMGLQARARDQAFALQEADAAARINRTPISQQSFRPFDKMFYQEQQQATEQQEQFDQIDNMRAQGILDDAQYERAKLGVLAGNEAMVRSAIAPAGETKPAISSTQELRILRDKFSRQRKPLLGERKLVQEWLAAPPGELEPDQLTAYQRRLGKITGALDQINQQEETAIASFRRGEAIVDPRTHEMGTSQDPYEGLTAIGPNGERIIRRGGQWVPIND